MSDRMVANVRQFSKATGYAKFLLLTIASHLHPQAVYAFPSLDTLARETTLSKPTVIHLIRTLEALGELEVRRGHGRGHPNRYRVTIAHEASPERSIEDDDDQPKGQPRLYLLTPEKVNEGAEKVNDTPGKGQAGLDPKEVLRTSKDTTERVAIDMEKVKDKDPDADEWVMLNRYYGMHRVCGHAHQPGTPCYAPWRANRP
jgi:biotin operon repressor